MSAEFSNAYQEILLDNLMAIIKQNFIFQTQLKLAEETNQKTTELQAKYDELLNTHEVLKNFKATADLNASAHEEKSRLQGALNDVMKKKTSLEKQVEEKDTEIIKLKDYISKLEGIAPQSKLKKINPEINFEMKSVEQSAEDTFSNKASDGSSF